MKTLDKLGILYQLGLDKNHPKIFSFHDSLPDVFSGILELLMVKRYKILGGQELLESLTLHRGSKISRSGVSREVALTIDDGRRNCWTVLFPLLKKYRVKAIVLVIPSRIQETDEDYPNLKDYWDGKVSWENLYSSHRRQPYLTWKELRLMQESGLVEIGSHSLRHDVVAVSGNVVDFQHPGVYEMPVYFDEWFQSQESYADCLWGAPIYERAWAALASNCYEPNRERDRSMNEFVKKNGGFLFFKKKDWRRKLSQYYSTLAGSSGAGHFRKMAHQEGARASIVDSKQIIEGRLKKECLFFSLPLYQGTPEILSWIEEAGYKAVFTGPSLRKPRNFSGPGHHDSLFVLGRIPSFWIKFLNYF